MSQHLDRRGQGKMEARRSMGSERSQIVEEKSKSSPQRWTTEDC